MWKETGGARAWSDTVATLMVLDLRARELLWSKTEDAEKGHNRPEMVPYPTVEGEEEQTATKLDAQAEKFLRMEQMRAERRRPTTKEG